MLFRKDIEPRCQYCRYATPISEDEVVCRKKGVAFAGGACRWFRYDPYKRTPPPAPVPDFSRLRDEDFALD